ncbi:hypothetical protein NQ317_006181 [Molorchus minor]|uniref:Uncharacterized protein n=1 Tax=Molorchus minor TaxID=1323400 RepID=A0ABQ9JBP7_9CUCU|nr:hypothetical protein NQ317_006181 [Molorchus minor]
MNSAKTATTFNKKIGFPEQKLKFDSLSTNILTCESNDMTLTKKIISTARAPKPIAAFNQAVVLGFDIVRLRGPWYG